jgi:hypothetical protein
MQKTHNFGRQKQKSRFLIRRLLNINSNQTLKYLFTGKSLIRLPEAW